MGMLKKIVSVFLRNKTETAPPKVPQTVAAKNDMVVYTEGPEQKSQYIDPLMVAVMDDLHNGKPIEEIARMVSEQTGMDFDECEEKVHTFASAYHNGADVRAYRRAGVKEYEFMATFDDRVCPVCYALDGQHFKIKDAKIGVNFPPMHLGCRCTTVEYDPEDEADWIASGVPMPKRLKLPYDAFRKELADQRNREIYDDSVRIAKSTADVSTFLSRYDFIWEYGGAGEDTGAYKNRLMMCIKRAILNAKQLKTARGKINRLNKMIAEIEAHEPASDEVNAIHRYAIDYLQNQIKDFEQ